MKHVFKPTMAVIKKVVQETPDTKSFFFKRDLWDNHKPGQFAELWVPGTGEIPLSIASSPDDEFITFTVKKVGSVTSALFEKKEGDTIGIRGPFGNGFPLEKFNGRELVFVGGGIGLPPLMSTIIYALGRRESFQGIKLFYGARTPADLVYRDQLEKLSEKINVYLTVDQGTDSWEGSVGVVTEIITPERVNPDNSVAMVCGPGIMMYFTVKKLMELGFKPSNIYLSLEHHMKCAVGKCGHCRIGPYYVCVDGPIFSYETLKEVEEKFAGDIWE